MLPAQWRCFRTLLAYYRYRAIVPQKGLYWPFRFPANRIDPPKVFFYTFFGNEEYHACLYCRALKFIKALREVFCHFLSALIKE